MLLLAGAVTAFFWAPSWLPELEQWIRGDEVAEESRPTPELAEETLDRFESFRAGEAGDRLSLGGAAISSVIRFALPGIVPPGVHDPLVELRDGRVILSARVATDAFPEFPSLREVVGVLPDTVDILMRGSLLPFEERQSALHVDAVQAMRIPLPNRFIPRILETLGRQDRRGLPPDAMVIHLPEGLEQAYVLRDSLILRAADR